MLGARAFDAKPAGAFILMRERQDGGDARVGGEEAVEEFGAVALAAAMEKDDVAREAVRAAGKAGAIEDGLDGGEGLGVGEVAAAAHDALLEVVGAVAVFFHVGVVVGLDGKEVDATEFFDEGMGDVAEVGGETGAVAVGFHDEAVGAGGVMGEVEDVEGDALHRGECVVERDDELLQAVGREAFFFEFELEVADFGGLEEGGEVAAGDVDFNIVFKDGEEPVKVEVVGIEVGEDDGGDVGKGHSDAVQALFCDAGTEAGIEEEGAPWGADDGGVA